MIHIYVRTIFIWIKSLAHLYMFVLWWAMKRRSWNEEKLFFWKFPTLWTFNWRRIFRVIFCIKFITSWFAKFLRFVDNYSQNGQFCSPVILLNIYIFLDIIESLSYQQLNYFHSDAESKYSTIIKIMSKQK